MRNAQQIEDSLYQSGLVVGFNPMEIQQGSDEWLHMKLGVISASNASKIMNSKTQTYKTYMNELIGQVATAEIGEQISAKPLEWGKMHEDAARSLYEFETKEKIIEYPFIYKDERMRSGCSPDGLMGVLGAEIKCPFTTKVHIELACNEAIKKEYEHQVQFSMWVTDADVWHFCSYDPRMKSNQLIVKIIERNDSFMSLYDLAVEEFSYQMDLKLKKLGINWGDQWRK